MTQGETGDEERSPENDLDGAQSTPLNNVEPTAATSASEEQSRARELGLPSEDSIVADGDEEQDKRGTCNSPSDPLPAEQKDKDKETAETRAPESCCAEVDHLSPQSGNQVDFISKAESAKTQEGGLTRLKNGISLPGRLKNGISLPGRLKSAQDAKPAVTFWDDTSTSASEEQDSVLEPSTPREGVLVADDQEEKANHFPPPTSKDKKTRKGGRSDAAGSQGPQYKRRTQEHSYGLAKTVSTTGSRGVNPSTGHPNTSQHQAGFSVSGGSDESVCGTSARESHIDTG